MTSSFCLGVFIPIPTYHPVLKIFVPVVTHETQFQYGVAPVIPACKNHVNQFISFVQFVPFVQSVPIYFVHKPSKSDACGEGISVSVISIAIYSLVGSDAILKSVPRLSEAYQIYTYALSPVAPTAHVFHCGHTAPSVPLYFIHKPVKSSTIGDTNFVPVDNIAIYANAGSKTHV